MVIIIGRLFVIYYIKVYETALINYLTNLDLANRYILYKRVGDGVLDVPKHPKNCVGADIIRPL